MNLLSPVIAFLLVETQAMAEPPAAPALPVALPLERYTPMLEHSPFAVATQAAPPAPVADAGFAKDLVLTGAVRLASGEYISFASRDQTQHFSLKSGESYNGISVVGVSWSDSVGKTKATLKCGNEFGVVGFDEALMRSPVATVNTAAPNPLSNNTSTSAPQGAPLPNANNLPVTPGTVVVPRSPGAPPAATPYRRIIRSVPVMP